jgi:hypothetical protein
VTWEDSAPDRAGDHFTFGNELQRAVYHDRYHTGENMAIRHVLGHGRLPELVGNSTTRRRFDPSVGKASEVARGSVPPATVSRVDRARRRLEA